MKIKSLSIDFKIKSHFSKLASNMIKSLLLMFFIASGSCAFSQGRVDGFYKGKGNADIVLGGGSEFTSNFYAGKNKIALPRDIHNLNLFIGAGLLDNLDLNLSVPFVMINNVRSLQDGSIYLKYKAYNKDLKKGNLSFSIATGFSSNIVDYETEGLSAIGQQAKVLDIRPVVHYFSNNGWFGTAQVAYNHKNDPIPNAFNTALKIGKAMAKDYFDVWYDYQNSFGGLDYRGTPAPTTFKQLGVDYHKIGATYYRTLAKKIGAYVGTSYVITGRNISQGPAFNLGLVLKTNF